MMSEKAVLPSYRRVYLEKFVLMSGKRHLYFETQMKNAKVALCFDRRLCRIVTNKAKKKA